MKRLIATASVVLLLLINHTQAKTTLNVQQEIASQWETIEFSLEKSDKINAYKILSNDVFLGERSLLILPFLHNKKFNDFNQANTAQKLSV